MTEARYKIIFDGEPMPGVALETVKDNLARLFKSDASRIESLFGGRSVALKRDLLEAEADKYLAALLKAGAKVRKEQDSSSGLSLLATDDHPDPAAPASAQDDYQTMDCPKCGHTQPKSAECQACGVIIEKYLARQAQLADEAVQASTTIGTVGEPASPYAPPQAQVGESLPEFGELKVFSLQGRIGRLRYLAWSTVMMLAFLPIGILIFSSSVRSETVAAIVTVLVSLAVIAVSVCMGVQRVHDMGWSGWLWLLNFVPVIGWVFSLLMLFMPGTAGANRYGPPPPPNSRAVKVLACLFLVPIIGIIAAIAIPAYQDYVMRAQLESPASFEAPAEMPAIQDQSAQ